MSLNYIQDPKIAKLKFISFALQVEKRLPMLRIRFLRNEEKALALGSFNSKPFVAAVHDVS
jgi:hypothetical protein